MARLKRWNMADTDTGYEQDMLDIFAFDGKDTNNDVDRGTEIGERHDVEQPGVEPRGAVASELDPLRGTVSVGSVQEPASSDRAGLDGSGLPQQPTEVDLGGTGRMDSADVGGVHSGVLGDLGPLSRVALAQRDGGSPASGGDQRDRVAVGGDGEGQRDGRDGAADVSGVDGPSRGEDLGAGAGSSGVLRPVQLPVPSGQGDRGVHGEPDSKDQRGEGRSYDDALTYQPTIEVVPPSSAKERARANIAAIKVMRELDEQDRWATPEEQSVLAAYSSWGAVPQIFETWREDWADEQRELSQLLSPAEHRAASATTLNAHYTDPAVVVAMWAALDSAGFQGGPVLEPGSGSGNFIGQAPQNTQMVGVELDPITARISHYLYPNAHVRAQGFEKTRFNGQFNAVVGNVPYGQIVLHDTIDNPRNLSIHNHFIVKALKNTAPGGYVAVLTSSFTMDSSRRTAREEMAKYGELLGAVRLPAGAMSRVAGTEAMTDIVVFRRYAQGQSMGDFYKAKQLGWLSSEPTTLTHDNGEAVEVPLNRYWAENPMNVLGEFGVGTGQYNPNTVRVRSELAHDSKALAGAVQDRLMAIIAEKSSTAPYDPKPAVAFAPRELDQGFFTPEAFVAQQIEGTLRVEKARLEVFTDGQWQVPRIPRGTTLDEQIKLIEVRDAAVNVLSTQSSSASMEAREAARSDLSQAYDAYSTAYGPINRFETVSKSLTVKQQEAEQNKRIRSWRLHNKEEIAELPDLAPPEDLVREWREEIAEMGRDLKRYPHLSLLRDDPEFALCLALEKFDEETQTASKAQIFVQDIVAQTPERHRADTPDAAVAISMDELREVNLDRVAQLLGVTHDEALNQLQGVAFVDPDTEQLVAATQYLSGDVRAKLDRALLRVDDDARFQLNVEALRGVVPEYLNFEDIAIRAGARYIPVDYYTAFGEQILKATISFQDDATSSNWRVEGPKRSTLDPTVLHEFGTDARNPLEILEAVMNNEQIKVSKTVDLPGGAKRSVRNVEATALARETAERLNTAFVHWLGSDPTRKQFIEVTYNELFNSYVAPDYTRMGEQLALPGMNPAYTPHPYQRAAAAQIVHEPAVLLDHVVGAGKTGSMIMGAMELRRNNLAAKPWLVVPNHLVEQIAKEWKSWYPDAKVMTVGTELSVKQRQQVILRSATGDWDGVIVPASSFGLMGVDGTRTARWIEEDIAELREAMAQTMSGNPDSKAYIKKIEKRIKSLEREYDKALERMDDGYTFEQSGCDYLFVDEAHNYKNLSRASSHAELSHNGSDRAKDLDFKLRALRESKLDALERAGKPTQGVIPAVATFATGTPVANSLAEMWVMQRYLRPDQLDAAGLRSIDAWAGQFTESATKLELGPDGSTWRMKDRIARFTNVPDLLRMTSQFTSTVTREQIPSTLPSLVGGEYAILSRPASEHVKDFVATLAARANNLPRDPSEDNLLKVTHEGRMVAIDPRTLGMDEDPDGGRVHMVAGEITRLHEDSKNLTFTDSYGGVDPVPGALQIVFLDRSTPNADGRFSVYEALRDELVLRGLPASSIAFIHDASDDLARDQLFSDCRSGKINVLIGSTEKMGTGTNVQKRALALHHFDVPWRPADLEQREGRILRQGNQNKEITINRYLTEGTYDAVMWQQVARKAAFIAQIKNGSTTRTLEQVSDDMTISAAAASAIATGDTRIIERAELTHRIEGLETLERAYAQKNSAARGELWSKEARHRKLELRLDNEKLVASMYRPSTADSFSMRIGERTFSDRGDGADALLGVMRASRLQKPPTVVVGGLDLTIAPFNDDRACIVSIDLVPHFSVAVEIDGSHSSAIGAVRRLENAVERASKASVSSEREIEELAAWIASAKDREESGFSGADELRQLRARLAEIEEALELTEASQAPQVEAVSYISETESERLYGEPKPTDSPRAGDIVSIKRKSGLWKVMSPSSNHVLVQREGSDSETVERVFNLDVIIERREHAALMSFEESLLSYDTPFVREKYVGTAMKGREYLVYGQPVVQRDRLFVMEGEPQLIRGVLVSSDREQIDGRSGFMNVLTLKQEGTHISAFLVGPNPEEQHRDHFLAQITKPAEPAKGVPISRLLPGDILVKGLGHQGAHSYLPPGTQVVESGVITPNGQEKRFSVLPYDLIGPQDFMLGSEITTEQQALVDLDLKQVPGNKLCAGDRTTTFSLGVKSALNREVVIVGRGGYGDFADLRFRVVDDYAADIETVRVPSSRLVAVAGRRIASLSPSEHAFLFDATAAHDLTSMTQPLTQVAVWGRELGVDEDFPASMFVGDIESYDSERNIALYTNPYGQQRVVLPTTPTAFTVERQPGARTDYTNGAARKVVELAAQPRPGTQSAAPPEYAPPIQPAQPPGPTLN